MTSNFKGDLKAFVIHGDLWLFPREFQKPGLSSHNSQEMQLKVSHRFLLRHVRTGGWCGTVTWQPPSQHLPGAGPLRMLSKAAPKTEGLMQKCSVKTIS